MECQGVRHQGKVAQDSGCNKERVMERILIGVLKDLHRGFPERGGKLIRLEWLGKYGVIRGIFINADGDKKYWSMACTLCEHEIPDDSTLSEENLNAAALISGQLSRRILEGCMGEPKILKFERK